MLSFFKSKEEKQVERALSKGNFFSGGFPSYYVQSIVQALTTPQHLEALKAIFQTSKFSHSKLLKASILILRMLQMGKNMQESEPLIQIIDNLQSKALSLLKQSVNKSSNYLKNQALYISIDQQPNEVPQLMYQSSTSLMVGKIVLPLLNLTKKILFCYDYAYKISDKTKYDEQLCWAITNLLIRYLKIVKNMSQIIIYYADEFISPIVLTLLILEQDIRKLYIVVRDQLFKRLREVIDKVKVKPIKAISPQVETQIGQVLLFVQQIQSLNQLMKTTYFCAYWSFALKQNKIFCPCLFSCDPEVDYLYNLLKKIKASKVASNLFGQKMKIQIINQSISLI